jgi:hypothetical protein
MGRDAVWTRRSYLIDEQDCRTVGIEVHGISNHLESTVTVMHGPGLSTPTPDELDALRGWLAGSPDFTARPIPALPTEGDGGRGGRRSVRRAWQPGGTPLHPVVWTLTDGEAGTSASWTVQDGRALEPRDRVRFGDWDVLLYATSSGRRVGRLPGRRGRPEPEARYGRAPGARSGASRAHPSPRCPGRARWAETVVFAGRRAARRARSGLARGPAGAELRSAGARGRLSACLILPIPSLPGVRMPDELPVV